ncbi:MAG: cation transporter [Clostridium sp.]|nr:cation transporter [Prevotella sp.]MCM1429620.1 cation transporter [Clostridium sp.]MCM1476099.1 cation transporter [Muribaculaceae bacterium]
MKTTFSIAGMTCPHCQAFATKAILAVKGVACAKVDLNPGRAVVDGDFNPQEVVEAINRAGYTASILE